VKWAYIILKLLGVFTLFNIVSLLLLIVPPMLLACSVAIRLAERRGKKVRVMAKEKQKKNREGQRHP